MLQVRILEITPVHKEILGVPRFATKSWFGHKTAQTNQLGIFLHRNQTIRKIFAQHSLYPLPEISRLEAVNHLTLRLQFKGQIRTSQGQSNKLLFEILGFRAIFFEEITPGRNIKKQRTHRNPGAQREGRGLILGDGTPLGLDQHPQFLIRHPAGHLDMRNRGDGSQGLAPKPVGIQTIQVFPIHNLGGGMSLQGQWNLVRWDALAVIHDLNQGATGVLEADPDQVGPGIHGVL